MRAPSLCLISLQTHGDSFERIQLLLWSFLKDGSHINIGSHVKNIRTSHKASLHCVILSVWQHYRNRDRCGEAHVNMAFMFVHVTHMRKVTASTSLHNTYDVFFCRHFSSLHLLGVLLQKYLSLTLHSVDF